MRKRGLTVCLFLLMSAPAAAAGLSVLLLGVGGGGAPSFGAACGRLLRDELSRIPEVSLVDPGETRDFARRLVDSDPSSMSAVLAESLRRHFGDSTLVVWVTVRSYHVGPVRRYAVLAQGGGDVSVRLSMVDLRMVSSALICDVRSVSERWIGPEFFVPLSKVHVPAGDIVKLTDDLAEQAARRCAAVLRSVASAKLAQRLAQERKGVAGPALEPLPDEVVPVVTAVHDTAVASSAGPIDSAAAAVAAIADSLGADTAGAGR